jgi:hypothetical protein
MPTIALPLRQSILDRPGSDRIRRLVSTACEGLRIETADGRWRRVNHCLIDTGAGYTQMSATLARSMGIHFPSETSELGQLNATGRRTIHVHDGELRVRFPQLPDHTFRLYCLFVEETPPSVPVLIGLHDTLDVFRLAFDGRPAADAPAGRILLETM